MWFNRILRPNDAAAAPGQLPPVRLSSRALRQLDRLQLRANRDLTGQGLGGRPSFRRKPAPDFREHRMYVPGDDVRFVDWRASARHEQVFIKQGELPKQAIVTILLDCSQSMAWGNPPKHTAQRQLAAALAYLALTNGDRVRLIPYGPLAENAFGPLSGKQQTLPAMKYLDTLRYGGSGSLASAARRTVAHTAGGGLVYILSDLLDEDDLGAALSLLPPPMWQVNVLQLLHPHEINPTLRGGLELVDSESAQRANYDITPKAVKEYRQNLEAWIKQMELVCIQHKAFLTTIPTGWTVGGLMLGRLRELKVVIPK